jgi:hypothetical protein
MCERRSKIVSPVIRALAENAAFNRRMIFSGRFSGGLGARAS